MKKATIKRRKRVIPAHQEEDGEDEEAATNASAARSTATTPERGTMNDDGSINLGFRRRPEQSMSSYDSERMGHRSKPASPLPASSDLAAYHQSTPASRYIPTSLSDENRLPPLTSMAAVPDRKPSLSPGSYLSPSRKRSFSTTETESATGTDGGHESVKRLSSIKDILNPSSASGGSLNRSQREGERGEYSLPPIRSPGFPGPTIGSGHASHEGSSIGHEDSEDQKNQRRVALQQETDRIRDMLAAKERELHALGMN